MLFLNRTQSIVSGEVGSLQATEQSQTQQPQEQKVMNRKQYCCQHHMYRQSNLLPPSEVTGQV